MARTLQLISSSETCVVDDGRYVIGRSADAALVVDTPMVSREHLLVRSEGDQWVIEDLGSAFGTFRDGEPVTRVEVVDGIVVLHLGAPDGPAVEFVPSESEVAPPERVRPVASSGPRTSGTHRTTHALRAELRIGRSDDNDIVLHDLSVSREHAALSMSGGQVEIRDLRSANGTFVNGRRVRTAPLHEGDRVEVGHYEFRFVGGQLEEYVDTGLITFSARDVVVETDSGVRLVDGVDFSLDEKSLLAVVGPSGAGKSTLLSVLTGLRPATEGVVLYEDRDLHREGEALRNRIGVVPQADLLHDGLTIRRSLGYTEQLRLPPDVSAEERVARIDDVLEQLGLDHRIDSRIERLSGGERKRVNVATELLTEPSLILLDEPASGLDAGLERTLMLMLRDLADEGHTVVVVTHSLDSLHLCDRVLVLAPGGIPAYFGPPDGMRSHFGGTELVDVFHQMSEGDGRDWRCAPAPTDRDGDRDPAADRDGTPGGEPSDGISGASLAARTWFGQLRALSSRFAHVLAADRRNALLLVLQAPILGLLMAIALPTAELAPPGETEIRFVSTAGLVLFVVLLGATWLGANNAIREIARERALFQRERAVGLSTSAYVLSKVVVLGAITVVQAFVLVPIALSRQGGPVDAVVLGWPMGEIMIAAAFAGLASMSLALLVSAAVGTPDRATTLLPIVLILQFVLSAGGVLPELTDRVVLREMSLASSAQWGFSATASTADLNELQAFTNQLGDLRSVDAADPLPAIEALQQPQEPNQRWAHEPSAWATSMAMLVVLTVVPVAVAIGILRRRKPFT